MFKAMTFSNSSVKYGESGHYPGLCQVDKGYPRIVDEVRPVQVEMPKQPQ